MCRHVCGHTIQMCSSDNFPLRIVQMAAFIALERVLGAHSSDIIASFLHRSQTAAATCAEDASDIANLAEITDADMQAHAGFIWKDSLEMMTLYLARAHG